MFLSFSNDIYDKDKKINKLPDFICQTLDQYCGKL